ncbi:Ltp family lipoprotein [Kocuria flava]|uniref:Ltp family lipoprotein n=1 Tax=Kocuria flava TaxID=446860 RepID=UPI001FF66015|nr:Ltp family lipoprotein [Kocuria flava]MCJ8505784.1 Ltp family lipoprotein [Kocuria flava]
MSSTPQDPNPQGPDYGRQPGGHPGQYPPPGYGQQPPQKKSKKKWAIGCLGLIVLVIVLFAGCSALLGGGTDDPAPTSGETSSTPSSAATEDASATDETPATAESGPAEAETEADNAEQSSATVAQRNAIRSAENYIDFSAFSRSGLIDQLEFEGYSTADATFAVDSLDIDYNEQAAKSAANYLETSAFSRSGLIDQLMFEGYTAEQATYGVDQTGL